MTRTGLILTLVAVLVAGACGADDDPAAAPASSTTAMAPPTTTTGAVLSLEAPGIDWPPITDIETSSISVDDALEREPMRLEGYRPVVALTSPGGLGSYVAQIPVGWDRWVAGDDSAHIVEVLSEKDPAWARATSTQIPGPGEASGFRGFFIDNDAPYLLTLSVVAFRTDVTTMDGAYESALSQVKRGVLLRADTFAGESGDGSVELSIRYPVDDSGQIEDVITHGAFVLDTENAVVWRLTCSVHASVLVETYEICWTSIRSFMPFGMMEG